MMRPDHRSCRRGLGKVAMIACLMGAAWCLSGQVTAQVKLPPLKPMGERGVIRLAPKIENHLRRLFANPNITLDVTSDASAHVYIGKELVGLVYGGGDGEFSFIVDIERKAL